MTEACDVPMRGGGSCVDVVWPDTYLSHYVSLACAGDPRGGSHSQRPGRGAVHHLMPRAVPRATSFGSSHRDIADICRRAFLRQSQRSRKLTAYDTKRRHWLICARHSPAFSAGALRQAWRLLPAHYSGLICVASPQRQGDVFHHFGRKPRCLRA